MRWRIVAPAIGATIGCTGNPVDGCGKRSARKKAGGTETARPA
jgi:hypothetical protein